MNLVNEELKNSTLDLCCSVAGRNKAVAACLYGPLASGYADEKSSINFMLVLDGYKPLLKTHRRSLDERDAYCLAVDQGTFQKDVSAGWLGEFAADKLLIPYDPLINSDYLWYKEVALKKRIIWELLENIVMEFPELSHELLIRPEYFMSETLMQRARMFPPLTYLFLNMLRKDLKVRNVERMMKGYKEALGELSKENWIISTPEEVRITPRLISTAKARRLKIPPFLRSFQRAAWLNILSSLPKMMNPLAHDEEIHKKTHTDLTYAEELETELENPRNFILMPTPLGPVPISDKTNIEEFVRKTVPGASVSKVEIREIGGVLNSVYLLNIQKDHEQQKVVVKKFKDWVGFKWFPLAVWALGTKSFAVLGRSRLEREYALNQLLHSKGTPVPKILYISPSESLVFQEFVEGENLAEIMKRIITQERANEKELKLIGQVGRVVAEAHQNGVVLGDCKPENFIFATDGKLHLLDLEQASRDGNQPWDVAEFLYYSGHYVRPLGSASVCELVAKAFIDGYFEGGGKKETVKKAASPRYTKVFGIFTQPHVILAISNMCKRAADRERLSNL